MTNYERCIGREKKLQPAQGQLKMAPLKRLGTVKLLHAAFQYTKIAPY